MCLKWQLRGAGTCVNLLGAGSIPGPIHNSKTRAQDQVTNERREDLQRKLFTSRKKARIPWLSSWSLPSVLSSLLLVLFGLRPSIVCLLAPTAASMSRSGPKLVPTSGPKLVCLHRGEGWLAIRGSLPGSTRFVPHWFSESHPELSIKKSSRDAGSLQLFCFQALPRDRAWKSQLSFQKTKMPFSKFQLHHRPALPVYTKNTETAHYGS